MNMAASGQPDIDLLIIGGGISGAGIARDAAGRGLGIALVERDGLAGHTFSACTKLNHGGLRYLEQGEFRLVGEALIERERLWAMAPHVIWPLPFVLPQTNSPRPAWMVRTCLFVYDYLAGRRKLPGTETIALDTDPRSRGLRTPRGKAFIYSDCWVEDSRLIDYLLASDGQPAPMISCSAAVNSVCTSILTRPARSMPISSTGARDRIGQASRAQLGS